MDPLNTNPIASGGQIPPLSTMPEKPKSTIGPLAGAIIIILLLVAGGLYFWGAQLNKTADMPPYIPNDPAAQNTEASAQNTITSDTSAGLPAQSNSDDIASIEADAAAMDMSQLNSQNNADLDNI